ncbi:MULTISPECIES: ABC transporter ATP-binding protein [unclassified Chelatococcus]|uniref:ABC transporter ATP-binding protein n=1 Tax=unclassified Chelatococcus TaxID=2638111 RepID=UPI0025C67AF8|nr:ABC transporter ATP-binding protein [Chelatococcus sp.]
MLQSPPRTIARPALEAEGVAFSYGSASILKSLNVTVRGAEILALLGPSGCGKTTLLKLIAGLLAPTAGRIRIGGEIVADANARKVLPPERRGLGMVFQDYALWPHLSVARNVSFPLEMRGVGRAERDSRAREALRRVGLAAFADRSPGSLSGGQQQRVSIARAIVSEPRLVLFDEPLSNLDRDLKETLVGEISSLIRELGLSGVYVTHDHAEAFGLADRVAVMRAGKIIQLDAPEQLVNVPASPDVCEFLHLGTMADVEIREGEIYVPAARMAIGRLPAGWHGARNGRLLLRRDSLVPSVLGPQSLPGTVTRSLFRGDHYLLTVRLGEDDAPGLPVTVIAPSRAAIGEVLALDLTMDRLRFFPSEAARPASLETTP